jgi:hypothetical protein
MMRYIDKIRELPIILPTDMEIHLEVEDISKLSTIIPKPHLITWENGDITIFIKQMNDE